MRKCLLLLLLLVSCSVIAAPELTDDQRARLKDGTTDRNDVLDQEDGLYVLLRNASTWQGDDFSGDAGAAVAPPPDYQFLKDKPEQARGNVYLIEGWLMRAERWPTDKNHSSDKLVRAGNAAWGDQVTRWTIVTKKGDPEATVIVLFNDPNAKMTAPEDGSRVRIAARFHKQWTIPSATGKPFTYPVFVGGAAEQVASTGVSTSSGGANSPFTLVLGAVLVVAGFFVGMRYLMRRLSTQTGGGTMLQDRLDEMRRQREAHEQEEPEEEDTGDLPEDPVDALDVLRQKHDVSEQ